MENTVPPAIGSDGTVYVGSDDSKLYALDKFGSSIDYSLIDPQSILSPEGNELAITIGSWSINKLVFNQNGGKVVVRLDKVLQLTGHRYRATFGS